jgi:hypothetical protein
MGRGQMSQCAIVQCRRTGRLGPLVLIKFAPGIIELSLAERTLFSKPCAGR